MFLNNQQFTEEIKREVKKFQEKIDNENTATRIETCIISYNKRIASLGLMQGSGCLGLVHWDDLEGWCWGGGERGVWDWNTCTPVADSC